MRFKLLICAANMVVAGTSVGVATTYEVNAVMRGFYNSNRNICGVSATENDAFTLRIATDVVCTVPLLAGLPMLIAALEVFGGLRRRQAPD